jgi:hypothetical protein
VARAFLTDFLLPLVKGGALHVGRPLGRRAVSKLMAPFIQAEAARALARDDDRAGGDGWQPPLDPDGRAALEIARYRRAQAAELLVACAAPPLDEISFRLGAAVHDLLALAHPTLAGRGAEARHQRIGAAALELAEVGAPGSAVEAVNRHSLLARLPEIARSDRTVRFWIGQSTFVGRVPPRRVTALPRLRSVRVELVRRSWLREIGIPAAGRAAFLALNIASPLGEALDPLRLDPPLAWSRILPVLRFPALCRAVAGRALELGVKRTGDAFADALFRFASLQDPPGGLSATPEAVRFAIRFLAHLVWLDLLFPAPRPGAGEQSPDLGLELSVILAAAQQISADLVWPSDLPRDGQLGRAFAARLLAMGAQVDERRPPRFEAALGVARLAAARLELNAERVG